MSWSNAEADFFVICLFQRKHDGEEAESLRFLTEFEHTARDSGGNIQLRSDRPKAWEIFDGKDHFREPDHLNPATFDFNAVMLVGFHSTEDMHMWWNSDQVFSLLKLRTCIEKMGIFAVEGLQQSYDILERNKVGFGDRLMLFEFIKMDAFKPMQIYVDNYKRVSEKAMAETGVDCNLLFAESVVCVLMNEFPLDLACASSWRMRSDASTWYNAATYQELLLPTRMEYARCLTVLVPMFEERLEDLEKARKAFKHGQMVRDSFKMLMGPKGLTQ